MHKKVVLAFSGGLDTCFCVAYLREKGYQVFSLYVDTGGNSSQELALIEERALKLGVESHKCLDKRSEMFERFAAYVIKGNILRGNIYPLCVGAERTIQARSLVQYASSIGADAVCHGCTGAGNDQVRFDVEIRCVNPELQIIAPIRELQLSRQAELEALQAYGLNFPEKRSTYSINQGILGTTIGGAETHNSWQNLPEEAWVLTKEKGLPLPAREILLTFDQGLPSALDSQKLDGAQILEKLNLLGGEYKIGRGMHVGDTVLGIKGRVAFEAPGASLLIMAHRELEKLVLTKWQAHIKEQAIQLYSMLLHEGQWSNPVMRDIEALVDSSQKLVQGEVRLKLEQGHFSLEGCRSPYSLMHSKAVYGEGSKLWDGRDAEGFCKISATQSMLACARTSNIMEQHE